MHNDLQRQINFKSGYYSYSNSKKMMKYFLLSSLLIISCLIFGQEDHYWFPKKDFLIIQSTKDYKSAVVTAREAAETFNLKLETPLEDSTFLTLQSNLEARGRYDDGIYVSIEYSNNYSSFSKGFFIVMVGSGDRNDTQMKEVLKKLKTKYSDAYFKTCEVYIGCIH